MLIETTAVLKAYIRTRTRPFRGQDWFDDANQPQCCCPVGVLCLDKASKPIQLDTSMVGEFIPNIEMAYIDGFVAAWEGGPIRPTEHGYERCECLPDQRCSCGEALNLFDSGYTNGERVRLDFERLGLLR